MVVDIQKEVHKMPLVCNIFLCLEIVLLLAYGVIRNLG